MNTLGDIVRQYGPAYEEKYGDRMLPSHRRTLRDIAHCRTAAMGGHVYQCTDCGETRYQYHSCQVSWPDSDWIYKITRTIA